MRSLPAFEDPDQNQKSVRGSGFWQTGIKHDILDTRLQEDSLRSHHEIYI